jgi:hypothetical protein
MPLNTRTTTTAVHRTTVTYTPTPGAAKDGGRAWWMETLKLLREHGKPGTLTVNLGLGASITSIIFEEKEVIPQRNIEFGEDILPNLPN